MPLNIVRIEIKGYFSEPVIEINCHIITIITNHFTKCDTHTFLTAYFYWIAEFIDIPITSTDTRNQLQGTQWYVIIETEGIQKTYTGKYDFTILQWPIPCKVETFLYLLNR